jgi:hypothetical protein
MSYRFRGGQTGKKTFDLRELLNLVAAGSFFAYTIGTGDFQVKYSVALRKTPRFESGKASKIRSEMLRQLREAPKQEHEEVRGVPYCCGLSKQEVVVL